MEISILSFRSIQTRRPAFLLLPEVLVSMVIFSIVLMTMWSLTYGAIKGYKNFNDKNDRFEAARELFVIPEFSYFLKKTAKKLAENKSNKIEVSFDKKKFKSVDPKLKLTVSKIDKASDLFQFKDSEPEFVFVHLNDDKGALLSRLVLL